MGECATTTSCSDSDDVTRRYDQILSYLLSNTVAGEIMAIQNYSEMVPLMPDTASRIEAVNQAHEECKHIALLEKVGRTRGLPVANEIIEPPWKAIRAHFHSAATRGGPALRHVRAGRGDAARCRSDVERVRRDRV